MVQDDAEDFRYTSNTLTFRSLLCHFITLITSENTQEKLCSDLSAQ